MKIILIPMMLFIAYETLEEIYLTFKNFKRESKSFYEFVKDGELRSILFNTIMSFAMVYLLYGAWENK